MADSGLGSGCPWAVPNHPVNSKSLIRYVACKCVMCPYAWMFVNNLLANSTDVIYKGKLHFPSASLVWNETIYTTVAVGSCV